MDIESHLKLHKLQIASDGLINACLMFLGQFLLPHKYSMCILSNKQKGTAAQPRMFKVM